MAILWNRKHGRTCGAGDNLLTLLMTLIDHFSSIDFLDLTDEIPKGKGYPMLYINRP